MTGGQRVPSKEGSVPRHVSRLASAARAALQEPDFAEQERLHRELAGEFRRELPATYLYPGVSPIVAHRRIRGFDHDGWIPPAWRWVFAGLEWLWVEREASGGNKAGDGEETGGIGERGRGRRRGSEGPEGTDAKVGGSGP